MQPNNTRTAFYVIVWRKGEHIATGRRVGPFIGKRSALDAVTMWEARGMHATMSEQIERD